MDGIYWPLAAILARWRRPVASVIALDPLRRLMRSVSHQRTNRASKMTNKYGAFLLLFFWHNPTVHPGGDTERILVRWQRPVASCEALDPLYWSILGVL